MDTKKRTLPTKLKVLQAANVIFGGITLWLTMYILDIGWNSETGRYLALLYFGMAVGYFVLAGILEIPKLIILVIESIWFGSIFVFNLITIDILQLIAPGICLFLLLSGDSRAYYTKKHYVEPYLAEKTLEEEIRIREE